MKFRTRLGAIGAVLALAASAACSHSPTEPSALPATVDMAIGQTLTVPGTDLRLTMRAAEPCPPYADCIPGPYAVLIASAAGRPPVELLAATPFGGGPMPPQSADGYAVIVRFVAEDRAGVLHANLLIDRS